MPKSALKQGRAPGRGSSEVLAPPYDRRGMLLLAVVVVVVAAEGTR